MGSRSRRHRFVSFISVIATLLVLAMSLVANQGTAYASGNPPSHVLPAPSGGVNSLHGANPGLKHGVKRITTTRRTASGVIAASTVTWVRSNHHGAWAQR